MTRRREERLAVAKLATVALNVMPCGSRGLRWLLNTFVTMTITMRHTTLKQIAIVSGTQLSRKSFSHQEVVFACLWVSWCSAPSLSTLLLSAVVLSGVRYEGSTGSTPYQCSWSVGCVGLRARARGCISGGVDTRSSVECQIEIARGVTLLDNLAIAHGDVYK